MFYRHKKVKS